MSTVDCEALRTQLAEAQTAYHKLLIGAKAQTVNFGPSKATTFTQANVAELRRYINELTDQIAACCGGTAAPRGPVRFEF